MAFELEFVWDSVIWNIIGQPQNYAQFMLNLKPNGHVILHAESAMCSEVHSGFSF